MKKPHKRGCMSNIKKAFLGVKSGKFKGVTLLMGGKVAFSTVNTLNEAGIKSACLEIKKILNIYTLLKTKYILTVCFEEDLADEAELNIWKKNLSTLESVNYFYCDSIWLSNMIDKESQNSEDQNSSFNEKAKQIASKMIPKEKENEFLSYKGFSDSFLFANYCRSLAAKKTVEI